MKRRGSNLRKFVMRHFVAPLLRFLPLGLAHLATEFIGRVEFALNARYRNWLLEAIRDNIDRTGVNWDLHETARLVSGRMARWRVRDLLLGGKNSSRVLENYFVQGEENLKTAIAQGKGVILLSNHFGAHIQVANWMLRSGIEFRFLTERPRHLSKELAQYFRSEGPLGQKDLFLSRSKAGNAATAAIMRALKCLKAGHVVLTTNDVRWNDNRSVVGRLMGIDWKFTSTWVMLAQRSQAPVVPVFCLMKADGRHELRFLPPEQIPIDADLTEVIQKSLDRLQEMINAEPGNSTEFIGWSLDRSPEGLEVRVTPVETKPGQKIPAPHFDLAGKPESNEAGLTGNSH